MNAESTQSRPFPPEFVAYHHRGAPLEGFVSSTQIGYFKLWPLAEIETWNREYEVAEYAPELLAFGSNGAGEMLAFNRLNQVLMVPFIAMEMEDAILLAASWSDFERILGL